MTQIFMPISLTKVVHRNIHFNAFTDCHNKVNFEAEAWFIKVICSVIVFRCSQKAKGAVDFSCLGYFETSLRSPLIAFEVIKRLNDPILSLKYFEYSRMRFEEQGFKHSGNTYNLLVRNLCHVGLHDAALKVIFDGHFAESSILDFLVSSCGENGKFDIAKRVFVQAYNSKMRVSSFTYNCLLNILVKRNRVDEAVSFFREQHLRFGFFPDTCSFNIVIRGLCRIGDVGRAFEFFKDMESFHCSPDVVTYNTIINGLFRAKEIDRGRQVLKEMQLQNGLSPDVVTYTSVISGYCKLGRMDHASAVYDEMIDLGIRPNLFTYNVLIDGFGKTGDMGSAVAVYDRMLVMGYHPDVVTLSSLIDGFCRTGKVDEAMKLWHDMGKRKVSPNAYTFAILINSFCKENRLSEARDFLRQLKLKVIVPQAFMYNPVIDGFCKAGNVDEANVIMTEMEENRCNPDKLTYTILIIGHCMKGRMLEAVSIFNKMLTSGCAPDDITVNSLRSCLLKAGMPNEAKQITLTVLNKDFDLNMPSSRKVQPLRQNMNVSVAV